jgi:hypothetical protein
LRSSIGEADLAARSQELEADEKELEEMVGAMEARDSDLRAAELELERRDEELDAVEATVAGTARKIMFDAPFVYDGDAMTTAVTTVSTIRRMTMRWFRRWYG